MGREKMNRNRFAWKELWDSGRKNKQMKEELDREQAADEAKTEFLSGISYNLRTPVNTIMGLTKLIRITEKMTPKLEDKLDKIDISSQYLCSILNNVLGMSEMEDGEMKILVSPFDMERLIRRVEYMVNFQAEEKGVGYETLLMVKNRIFIGDVLKIEQTINNLVENAVKYTNNGGKVELRIEELREQSHKAQVRFSVIDNGIGIEKENYEKVFQPFEKVRDGSNNSSMDGIGLGLSVSARLVELMGGKINVSSAPGKGTEFSFILELPVAPPEDIDEEYDGGPDVQENGTEEKRFAGIKVLLAEDNELNAEIAVSLLEHEKVIADHAANGQKAVDMFCGHPEGYYDIILMDIQMPVMNGWEAVEAIRSSGRQDSETVFIAAMTADASADSRQRAMNMGMDDFIVKPFEINEVYKILKKVKKA